MTSIAPVEADSNAADDQEADDNGKAAAASKNDEETLELLMGDLARIRLAADEMERKIVELMRKKRHHQERKN